MQKKGAASRPKKAPLASRVHVCVHFATRRLLSDGRVPSWTPSRYQKKELKKGQMVTGLRGTSL